MAKRVYGIPYSLDSSYLDMEIAIQSKDGIGMRPFPIKNILLGLFGIVTCFILLSKTFIAEGTFNQKVIFVIIWACLCFLLLTINKTKQLGVEKIVSLLNYMQAGSRYVNTRTMAGANPFIQITGFYDIDENGTIRYCDGSLGQVFDIIGNGSVLLFDEHKRMIIDRVDAHYRKIRPNTTYHYVTAKEPQNVYIQASYLAQKKAQLTVNDPDLNAMVDTNMHILKDIVGNSYKSLHQYLIIQAKNQEDLNLALSVFWSEVKTSAHMFKFAEQLNREEVIDFMKNIYGDVNE